MRKKFIFEIVIIQSWHIWAWWPWPLTPVSIGCLCYPGRTCVQSLRKVGHGVLELLIGNEKVTDGQTDMCKAICPLFFRSGA